jgi:hypothetical protein
VELSAVYSYADEDAIGYLNQGSIPYISVYQPVQYFPKKGGEADRMKNVALAQIMQIGLDVKLILTTL